MKKLLLSLAAVVAVVAGVFATGDTPANSFQQGSTTFSTFTGIALTNTFPIPYTIVPIVWAQATATNGAPYTVSSVTTSNFILTCTANTPTNCVALWYSQLPNTRIQTGTNTVVSATPLVVAFPVPYAYPPIVLGTFSTTNANSTLAINPQTTTTTNFTILENLGGIASWISIGSTFIPGTTTPTY